MYFAERNSFVEKIFKHLFEILSLDSNDQVLDHLQRNNKMTLKSTGSDRIWDMQIDEKTSWGNKLTLLNRNPHHKYFALAISHSEDFMAYKDADDFIQDFHRLQKHLEEELQIPAVYRTTNTQELDNYCFWHIDGNLIGLRLVDHDLYGCYDLELIISLGVECSQPSERAPWHLVISQKTMT